MAAAAAEEEDDPWKGLDKDWPTRAEKTAGPATKARDRGLAKLKAKRGIKVKADRAAKTAREEENAAQVSEATLRKMKADAAMEKMREAAAEKEKKKAQKEAAAARKKKRREKANECLKRFRAAKKAKLGEEEYRRLESEGRRKSPRREQSSGDSTGLM